MSNVLQFPKRSSSGSGLHGVATDGRPKTAVVLNGNARAVTHRTITELGQLIADQTLFVSRSLEQSRFIARQIINAGFDVVLCGGGDGTFTRVVTDIMALGPTNPPSFGVLPLGTGNAIGSALGVKSGKSSYLKRELEVLSRADKRVLLPLIRVEGQLTPFVGCGLDAMILQDYRNMKRAIPTDVARTLFEGKLGYGCSIATRSIWKYLLKPLPEVIIRNEGAPAARVDLDGRPAGRPIPDDGILYRGPATMAAAATIPFCGFGVRLYPQAGKREDRFHIRVGQTGVTSVVTKLPRFVRGQYEAEKLFDFYASAVTIEVPSGTAFQAGGDLIGSRTHIRLELDHVTAVTGSEGHAVTLTQPSLSDERSAAARRMARK